MEYNHIYSKSSVLDSIKPEKYVKLEKLVKLEKMPINEDKKTYNYDRKEKLAEIMKRIENSPDKLKKDFTEIYNNRSVIHSNEYIVGNICNYIISSSSNLESPGVKEQIQKISEKYKKKSV